LNQVQPTQAPSEMLGILSAPHFGIWRLNHVSQCHCLFVVIGRILARIMASKDVVALAGEGGTDI
jgi:hypothetical protein